MNKKVVFLVIMLMLTVSLSGCLGRGGGKGDGDKNMGSPEEVNADDYNVLYIGHSFGRVFAETLQDYAHTAGFTDHAQYIEMSGGASGAPMHYGKTMATVRTSRITSTLARLMFSS